MTRSADAVRPSGELVPKTPPMEDDAWKLLLDHIEGFTRKANHNKREALFFFVVVVATTLVTPIFIAYGEGQWFGKIVPSFCSLLATGATAWLQLRKPQQLWTLYRTAQRKLEDHRTRFQFRLHPYDVAEEPERVLAKWVAEIAFDVHEQWVPLVPAPEHLNWTEKTRNDSGVLGEGRPRK